MATSHGSNADVYAGGNILTSYFNSAAFSMSRDAAETTTFKKTQKTYIPGVGDTNMSLEGLFDGAAGAVDEILFGLSTADAVVWSYGPNGLELGKTAFSAVAFNTAYEITSDVGDANQISTEVQADGGYFNGTVVRAFAAGGASPTPSVDSGIVTNSQTIAAIQVSAGASLQITLADSADNSAFADLAGAVSQTFNAKGSAKITFTGTVRRYVRARWTGSGTFFVAIGIKA